MSILSSRTQRLGCLILLLNGMGCDASTKSTLRVYAATSLTELFTAGETSFEAQHPNVDVQLQFAGSQVLKMQITEGAPADVYASANRAHVQSLIDSRLLIEPFALAKNEMALIVPKGNPNRLHRLKDLPNVKRLVLGGHEVPAGVYARQVLTRAADDFGEEWLQQVHARVVSHEPNVRLVRTKVTMGEADAGLVYVTDANASKQVDVVPIAPEFNVSTEVVMGIASGGNTDLARDWALFWGGDEGVKQLGALGFAEGGP